MVAKNYTLTLQRLRRQVSALKRKEQAARMKLRAALRHFNKTLRTQQSSLQRQSLQTMAKVAAAEAAVYEKIVKTITKGQTKTNKRADQSVSSVKASLAARRRKRSTKH